MSIMLHGIGVSRGIAIGKAYLREHGQPEVSEYKVPDYLIDAEIDRYKAALDMARSQLVELRTQVPSSVPGEVTDFIDAHLLMLEDNAIRRGPTKMIRRQKCNAEWALKQQRDSLVQAFEDMADSYLRTRKDDIDHVINRIMRILLEQENDTQELIDPDENSSSRVVVSDNLTAAEIILLHNSGVAGIITEHGGPNSHSAILARSIHLPAVMGASNIHRYIKDGEELIINGDDGMILVDSNSKTINHYEELKGKELHRREALLKLRSQAAVTRDNSTITIQANVELYEDIDAMHQAGCDTVGLYRTEFLFLNREDLPTEDEQYNIYKQVVEKLERSTLTIRLLDIGTDKPIPAIAEMEAADNPALGVRGVRLLLKNMELLIPQLRAILRASAHGKIQIMLPMVTNNSEISQVREQLQTVMNSLKKDKLKFDTNLKVGVMIETPAAALAADSFAANSDFLSIGTNDLIQYSLAIDRTDDQVNYLFDPLHPAILRLIRQIIEASNKYHIPVSMCGEMAGDERYTRLLLGLGLREFSMNPSAIPEVKQAILNTRLDFLTPLADKMIKSADHEEIKLLFKEMNKFSMEHS
ncbi:MAG: phosphoenolpyruvate--protein phosphotransferase [Thiotrichales bacterium]|nr:phosphoenolpyruvate--protein phosphotransferase [Thiotrichales bacterium]MBT3613018.1 phosphoenolpyruvate--protein phosphotransferase [Thiotrichales bacterium]MBT3752816.1 phosphoenolpyruvate--protein phosphotransferase [Thiotrichales bacterium]MBT3837201.1 phosphoenolpyruvate--protein phosphotransferase [Thiotrichales bacterium]MBT4152784.1 phosphoenolpyruvate--protein phosphotransferase [Thiotrichales bacterium]